MFYKHLGGHISCVQFDGSGNFLAVGDKGGKINVFRAPAQVLCSNSDVLLYLTLQILC